MIHGMWTGRDRKGTNGSGLKGYERIGTEKGTNDSMVKKDTTCIMLGMDHMMAMGCQLGQYMSVGK